MLSCLRTAHITNAGIARISVAALLMLAVLAGMLPPGALSASETCRMACCAAKLPHESGACKAALPSAAPIAPTVDEALADDEHAAHHGNMQMSVTVDRTATDTHAASAHCETTKQRASPQRQTPTQRHAPLVAPAQQQQARLAADVLTKPCSEECAAAALSCAQLRRPRAAAVHALALKPRPPTLISRADRFKSLLPSSAAHRRQSRPRAPPASLVNLYA
ncbi:MAG TPA: hypothetical protein VGC89_20215 [Pyrinomonadaceae bacterium]